VQTLLYQTTSRDRWMAQNITNLASLMLASTKADSEFCVHFTTWQIQHGMLTEFIQNMNTA